MVMENLNQAKLMNEENWTKIETTDMRKNVRKKKTKKETEEWEKSSLDRKWKKQEKKNEKEQQEKRRECQEILRKSSQWCKWVMKRKRE